MNVQTFDLDLTDMDACGVYFVTAEDIETIATQADRDGFNVHEVDLADCRDHAGITQRMAEGFSLPESFGRNWTQLVEYLQRMDAIPSRGHIVLLRNNQILNQADSGALERVLDMFEETAAIWADEGVAFFVFTPIIEEAASMAR